MNPPPSSPAGASPSAPLIRDYAKGGFTIGDDFHKGAILIRGVEGDGFAIEPWNAPDDPDALRLDDFAPLLAAAQIPDLILLGVGERLTHPFAELRMALGKAGVPLEVQTTPAICRTWNLVLSEGRRAALAVMPVLNLK